MKDINIIKKMADNGTIAETLFRGSGSKKNVTALQNVLHEMGFDKELNWQRYGADGGYGNATVKAVKSFCAKNSIESDGESVSAEAGNMMVERYFVMDDLLLFIKIDKENRIDSFIYRGSPHVSGIKAVQTLLNALGYGKQLQWEKYGADGGYGKATTSAVNAFAADEDIENDGQKVTPQLAKKIITRMKTFFGDTIGKEKKPAKTVKISGLAINETNNRVTISDGLLKKQFGKYKKGVYTVGNQKTQDFIDANKQDLLAKGMSQSALNIMISVSENEGNLDAINTWDNSYMTFGLFQWTVGVRADPGELPALLKKIKAADKSVFKKYYGQYGLSLIETNDVTGFFKLNRTVLATGNEKKLLRTYQWAFLFWKSGQDPLVQSVQLDHAFSRIGRFYKSNGYKVNDYYISDLISSEYGIALLLDNHVNRPAYIAGCLKSALKNTGLQNPGDWTTAEEQALLKEYLTVRETFGKSPMTDAGKRAEVTKKYLDNGTISDERGSFVYP